MEIQCRSCEEEYVKLIAVEGHFLGLADLALLAGEQVSNIQVLHWDSELPDGCPAVRQLGQTLNLVMEEQLFQTKDGLDPADHLTWTFACTSATFERGAFLSMNHFVPLFTAQQVGERWQTDTTAILENQRRRIAKLKKKIDLLSQDSEEDEAIHESLMHRLTVLQNQHVFWQTMITAGYLPIDVPADGDCLLWSYRCLKGGAHIRLNLTNKDSVRDVRADTCQLFGRV